MNSQNLNNIDIIKIYQEEFSKYVQDFPIEEEQLYSYHKSIISSIKDQLNINSFSSKISK